MSGLLFSDFLTNILYDFCLLYACYNLCVFLSFSLMIPVMSVKITNYEALRYVDFSPLTVDSSVTDSVILSALFSLTLSLHLFFL
jgi:hypothetical protein